MTRVRLRQCPWAALELPSPVQAGSEHPSPPPPERAGARTGTHPRAPTHTLSLARAGEHEPHGEVGSLSRPLPRLRPLSRALCRRPPGRRAPCLPLGRRPPRAPTSAVNARGRGQMQKVTDLEKRKKARAPETPIRAPHRARTSPSRERDPQRLNPDLDWVRVRHSKTKVA